ncbi:MAG: tRNA uracil 4-sulfurtransferase ThiI [Gemmatimonadota bacterium]
MPKAVSAAPLPVCALVRYSGEIATKSRRTRARFQRRLERNLRAGLAARGAVESEIRLERGWSRLRVSGPDRAFLEVIAHTFGVSSYSVLEGECAADLEEIVATGKRLFAERVRARRFAVRARRSGRHEFGSGDIMVRLGAALNPGATVDLDDPEVVVRVEVRDARASFFSDRLRGPGGLPLGVQGRAVALLSGGFDSAVAAWMVLRRGVELDYVLCNLGGGAYERWVVEVAKVVADRWSHGSRPRLHVLDFTGVVDAMRAACRPSYLQVVLKRLMYGAASRIARETRADALVTGESIGQVSSQTLRNLRAIDDASSLPVLRPLAGHDKEEIIALARRVGTHDLSAKIREYCQVAPERPVTAARPEEVRAQTDAVDPSALEAALAGRRILDLRRMDPRDRAVGSLTVTEIPGGAQVVDTRDPAAFAQWHWPAAVHRDLDELARDFHTLDRERTYVLYCAEGIRTAHLAERMQAKGFEAYGFRGGVRALRRYAARLTGSDENAASGDDAGGEPGGSL